MNIKAVVIDVGGVLVQTVDNSPRNLWEHTLHLLPGQLAKEVFEREPGDLATIGQVKPEKIWMDIQKKFALSPDDLFQLQLDFYAGDRLNTEIYAYIQSLRGLYQTAILSNAWLDAREIYTKKYHLDAIVDEMILSAEVGIRKPNPEIYTLTLQQLHTTAHEVLYIDDNLDNIKAGVALGMHTLVFTTAQDTIEQMQSILFP